MKKAIWGITAVLVLGGVYYSYNPAGSALFPKCPFLVLTGLKCPGCGSQRAVHCLLHADLAGALHYNALLVCSLPIVLVLLYAEWSRTRHPRFYTRLQRPAYILAYFSLVVLWAVIRNLRDW